MKIKNDSFVTRINDYFKLAAGIYSNRPLGGPYTIQLGLSDACNYRCVMCNLFSPFSSEQKHILKSNVIMDFNTAQKLIKDLAGMGTKKINICGYGESLLFPRIVDIVKLIKSLGMKAYITTNGYLLDQKLSDGIIENDLDGLYVSLNCGLPQTYPAVHLGRSSKDFLRIISSIAYFRNRSLKENKNIFIVLSFVLMRINYKDIPDFFILAKDVKADYLLFRQLGTNSLAADSLMLDAGDISQIRKLALGLDKNTINNNLSCVIKNLSLKRRNKTACFAGYLGGTIITADGSVFACCNCSVPLGNINKENFRKIWYGGPSQDFRREGKEMWARKGFSPNKCLCKDCPTQSVNLKIQNFLYPWRMFVR